MIIIPSSYLPSISYFWAIFESQSHGCEGGDEGGEKSEHDGRSCVIDIGEHYVKRSLRNRTRIMTAQGVMELSIPIKRANRPRQPMSTIEIDNSKRWQHQHWMAILSAYKSSPYFDHFAPYIAPLYRREFCRLVEFNEALMSVIFRLLRLDARYRPTLSESYIEPTPADLDLRPKRALPTANFEPREYIQVFSDREPFAADLSILDLLFCEGVTSLEFLEANRR